MNFKQRIYKPALVALAVVLICGVSQIQQLLNRDRSDLGFTKITPLENAPPVLAFTTVALGGFRGLIANALWIRANDLQDEDKFFEMVQLSSWITQLEPHFSQVWIHQAWNMAYNISVKFQDPADRYRWLQRGIRLLRDEGLALNPDEALMYRDLSWMFQNKMGKDLDDAHMFYKGEWEKEMQDLFQGNANIPELLNPTTPEAKNRVKILREKYKMDPEIMDYVDKTYGPFEWRLPDAHAIYWAEAGRRKTKPLKDQETLRRSIYQSMQQACFTGKLTFGRGTNSNRVLGIGPYLDLTPKVSASYEQMMVEDPSSRPNISNAHRNFLKVAIYLLAADGRATDAKKWFAYMKKTYPESLDPKLTFDDYVLQQLSSQIRETDRPKTTSIILGTLRNSYTCLARDETDEANMYDYIARSIWAYYESMVPKNEASRGRIALDPLDVLRKVVLDQLLDPETGWLTPGEVAVLRTQLQMAPPPKADASTNAPALSPSK